MDCSVLVCCLVSAECDIPPRMPEPNTRRPVGIVAYRNKPTTRAKAQPYGIGAGSSVRRAGLRDLPPWPWSVCSPAWSSRSRPVPGRPQPMATAGRRRPFHPEAAGPTVCPAPVTAGRTRTSPPGPAAPAPPRRPPRRRHRLVRLLCRLRPSCRHRRPRLRRRHQRLRPSHPRRRHPYRRLRLSLCHQLRHLLSRHRSRRRPCHRRRR